MLRTPLRPAPLSVLMRALVLACLFVAPSCQLAEVTKFEPTNSVYTIPVFERRAPAVIAILPVQGAAMPDAEVSEAIRESLYWSLIDKRYAPLASDYVDSELRHAGAAGDADVQQLKGLLPCDAVLKADLEYLDVNTYRDSKKAKVRGKVELHELNSGSLLWSAKLEKLVRPSQSSGTQRPGQSYEEAAIERFFSLCLDQLPQRPIDTRALSTP